MTVETEVKIKINGYTIGTSARHLEMPSGSDYFYDWKHPKQTERANLIFDYTGEVFNVISFNGETTLATFPYAEFINTYGVQE